MEISRNTGFFWEDLQPHEPYAVRGHPLLNARVSTEWGEVIEILLQETDSEAGTCYGIAMTMQKPSKKSSKKGATAAPRKVRGPDGLVRTRRVLLGLIVLLCALVLVYPPWRDVWINFEGFHLRGPIAYGPFWSPPRSVFPTPRTIAVRRLGEEIAAIVGLGLLLYWLVGRGRTR